MRLWHLLAGLALLGAGAAQAHDTWFSPQADDSASGDAGRVRLKLGTGVRYPQLQSSVGETPLPQAACRHGEGSRQEITALKTERDTPQALWLAAAAPGRGAAPADPVTCWAQLPPYELVLAPHLISVYLNEIRASDAVRQIWAARAARGLPWVERYTKHARIELDRAPTAAQTTARSPTPLALDIVPGSLPLRTGQRLQVQVLRDGVPLPGLALELLSGTVAAGFWLRTDDDGRASVTVPLPGPWLLRGTDLRVDATRADAWDSRFVTLAFKALKD